MNGSGGGSLRQIGRTPRLTSKVLNPSMISIPSLFIAKDVKEGSVVDVGADGYDGQSDYASNAFRDPLIHT
jgi:hypothetical protein